VRLDDPSEAAVRRWRPLDVGIVLVVGTAWIAWRLRNLGMPIDLAVYRAGGEHALRGTDIYVLQSGNPFIEAFGRGYELHSSFTYPPFAAIVFVPLALLSTQIATIGWVLASLIALVKITWIGFQPLLSDAGGVYLGLLAGAFVFTVPVTDALFFGQIDLFILLLLLVDCTRTTRHRGIATGVATALKISPGLFIVYFLLTRRWDAARRAVLAFAAVTALAWILLPGSSWAYWTDPSSVAQRVGGAVSTSNQSLNGALLRLGAPGWLLLPMAAIVAVAGLALARLQHDRGQPLAAACSVGVVTLLIAPVSWIHHAVWIVPIIGVVLGDGAQRWRRRAAILIAIVFTLRLPLFGSLILQRPDLPIVGHVMEEAYVVAYMLLLVLLWQLSRQRPRDGAPLIGDG
jgi:alpha-1,2-mannosyltransferase